MVSTYTDRTLAKEYADRTADLSQEEAAERISVNQRTISNWRASKLPKKMRPATRRQILKVLENQVDSEGDDGAGPANPDLAAQINLVLAREADGWVAGYLVGEIRGAYRDAALKDLAAALLAAERNAALLSEERRGHREAILRIDENARATALELRRDQRPTGADPSPYGPPPEPKEGERKVSGD